MGFSIEETLDRDKNELIGRSNLIGSPTSIRETLGEAADP
jgi:hypothetical protein